MSGVALSLLAAAGLLFLSPPLWRWDNTDSAGLLTLLSLLFKGQQEGTQNQNEKSVGSWLSKKGDATCCVHQQLRGWGYAKGMLQNGLLWLTHPVLSTTTRQRRWGLLDSLLCRQGASTGVAGPEICIP